MIRLFFLSSLGAPRPFILALLLAMLAVVPAGAQQPAPAQSGPPASATGMSAAELNTLADQLENETERRRLIETLRALSAAQRGGGQPLPAQPAPAKAAEPAKAPGPAAAPAEDDPGAAIVDTVVEHVRRAGSGMAALGAVFSDLPALQTWLTQQWENPKRRALWADVLLKLGATLAVAVALQAIAFLLIRRPLAALEVRKSNPLWLASLFLLLRILLAIIPTAAFALAAYGTLWLLAPNNLTRDIAQIIVLAFVATRAVDIGTQMLLAPDAALSRSLRLDGETAAYIHVWLRRLSAVGIFGYAIVRIAQRIRIPADGVDAIATLAGFIFAFLLAVLVLQNRAAVAARIRGSDVPAADTASPRSNAVRLLRHRTGDIWHALALLYIGATFAVWAFDVSGGFALILRGTLATLGVLILVRVILFAIEHGLGGLFAVRPETRHRFPGLEARANRYLPLLLGSLRLLLYVVATFAILQAWGIDTLGWLGSSTGRNLAGRVTTILLVVVVTLVLWEVTGAGIEYYLTRPGRDGQPPMRSGRVRTLLPLLRRFVSIVLGLIAALIVLSELGINIAPLLAGAGVIGLAIGFGAQTLVKDVITGIFILAEETVSVGDIVDLGGNGGVVEDISIRTIRLRDTEGVVHVIPFSEVTRIKNMTRGYAQALFDIGISYREDVDAVIEEIRKLGAEFRGEPEWAARILEDLEMWGVNELADSAVVIRFRIKTQPAQQWSVKREFSKRLKKRFDELGIEMPFPHRTLYFGVDKAGNAPPVRLARAQANVPEAESDPKPVPE
ncbi:mechanosensitive ion channel [Ferrovibrio terrae]|uniref:Mechanosensitive ion channel n=1 Tax=Ferrovibrio terrae TaxID=2594003 RepID=A0A516GXC8_9PROT|nr:mechanosensitive ion channel domain-containing protein [Ferrovibrio terrae]QDO96194.1 mechanosensitive ion channel [Ferrovibrio terrae]